MPILNYTTSIDPMRSVAEIQRLLTAHGAERIVVENEGRAPAAIAFVFATNFGGRAYRLPANTAGVLKSLERERRKGRVSRAQATPEHAARVAWRIVLEWIKVQLAVVESGLVAMEEVMLPYMQVGEGGQTVYEVLSGHRLALPGPSS